MKSKNTKIQKDPLTRLAYIWITDVIAIFFIFINNFLVLENLCVRKKKVWLIPLIFVHFFHSRTEIMRVKLSQELRRESVLNGRMADSQYWACASSSWWCPLLYPPPGQSQWSLLANKPCSILGMPVFQIMQIWLDGLNFIGIRLSSLLSSQGYFQIKTQFDDDDDNINNNSNGNNKGNEENVSVYRCKVGYLLIIYLIHLIITKHFPHFPFNKC